MAKAMAEKAPKYEFTKKPYIEDVPSMKIDSINFSKFSGQEIHKFSEVQIWKTAFYAQGGTTPIENGLLDSHLGPASKTGVQCTTCHGDWNTCAGHWGHLKLALPVINIGFLPAVIDILKCICKSCARVLLSEETRKDRLRKIRGAKDTMQKTALAKAIVKECKPKQCYRCGFLNGMVKKATSSVAIQHNVGLSSSVVSITRDSKAPSAPVLNPVKILALFRRMLDEDCELLYVSERPERFVITDIAVPPISIRPSVVMNGGAMSNEDDTSQRLKKIIIANATLREDLECTKAISRCLGDWDYLQYEVALYVNSEARINPPNPSVVLDPLRGIVQRLKGKQGRFRGNLCGKRVQWTGRTVISPDPNLKITEVAVPVLIAKVLTYPELVSRHNIEKLRNCVRNGSNKYPGANYITKIDGSLLNLRYNTRNAVNELKYGDTVERHMEDGDVILFNRQPSLHRMSIMSHRARVMPWRTLRFNESVCNPYNADFDGDEMNMHLPQTEEARTEALLLMGVQNNLCTPKNGEILVASTQDFLTSSYLITRKDTFYDRSDFSLMCSYMGDAMDHIDLPTPTIMKPIELWTGKQLFSVLLRPRARMRVYINLTCLEKNYMKEEETMCSRDGFVYFRNSELLCGQLGKVTLGNGNKDGLFPTLLRDYDAHGAASCMNRLAKLSARWIGNHGFSIGIDDVQPGAALEDKKNANITDGYKSCEDLIKKYHKGELKQQPGFDAAQTLEASISHALNEIRSNAAKECEKELHWRNSPLIMSQCGSKGSFANITQMVACVGQQIVGGRRAPNGFIGRSLPHFYRESKEPAAKGFVGNSFYSGLTPTEFFFHTMGGREGLVDTAVKTAETGYMSRRLIKALEDLCGHYDYTVRNASRGVIQFVYGEDGMDPATMEGKDGRPLNFERLYLKVKATCPAGAHDTLSPAEVSKFVKEKLASEVGCSEMFIDEMRKFFEKQSDNLKETRRALQLSEDTIVNRFDLMENIAANISGITLQQLQVFFKTCFQRYHAKKIEPGTGVGAIGAQSIGEPGTQMTLKTFHFAGLASMDITQGVPRIREIIDGAKNISTPIITAKLDYKDDPKSAKLVKGYIEKTVLGHVAKSMKIVKTHRQGSIYITLNMEMIQSSLLSISARTVQQSILQQPRTKIKSQHIDVLNDSKLRIRPPEVDKKKKSNLHMELQSLVDVLSKVVVRGISSVERVVMEEKKYKDNEEKHWYQLLVEGTNLRAVMGIPGVNGCETSSNHILEVQKTLGIEAARRKIIEEINYTMKAYGMTIDIRHMMLLADLMTYKGDVLGITRFGVQKMKDSVLMLASFEKTGDHLFNASTNGRIDKIEGVSECIITGIQMGAGTGILKVLQRVQQPPKLNYGLDPILS